ncbi:serine/Arginine-related protein 53-like isoform X1 [Biomphalaria glabrata]|uniref:Serine/Arginine-related protein 53-like isoform X1 n=1 Tax=Biomphalaria glabrata TaxID=6526 RepID=A0A9W2ZEX2_BIOGL|nr:serine/Arginine-related protein 53-like isoform X1 [Biomphalaria glabrata]
MGRYRSDDSDGDYSKKMKKKKKRRGRSRSSSGSEASYVSSSKSKKMKKKQRRSRSRSRTPEKRRGGESRGSRRSRSNSLDKYISKRGRSRSTSLDKYVTRKNRSPDRRGTRKSWSRSPSPRRSRRSRTRSPVPARRRSRSYDRNRRSKSPARRRSYSRERSSSRRSSVESKRTRSSPSKSVSSSMNNLSLFQPSSVQAEKRMRQALMAAAAADEKLRETSSGLSGGNSFAESQAFANSVAAIESNSFVPSSFKSSRTYKVKEESTDLTSSSHDDAIFGSLTVTGFTIKPDPDTKPIQLDPDSIIHPSLYCDPEEKMERWIQRLTQLRRRKLEGEAIS